MALLLDPADPDVRAAADSSRETFVRLGAVPFIERLDATLATPPASDIRGATADQFEVNRS